MHSHKSSQIDGSRNVERGTLRARKVLTRMWVHDGEDSANPNVAFREIQPHSTRFGIFLIIISLHRKATKKQRMSSNIHKMRHISRKRNVTYQFVHVILLNNSSISRNERMLRFKYCNFFLREDNTIDFSFIRSSSTQVLCLPVQPCMCILEIYLRPTHACARTNRCVLVHCLFTSRRCGREVPRRRRR